MPPTSVRRRAAFNPVTTFRDHLTLKTEAKTIQSRADALKTRLKEYLPTATEAYANEKGSIFWDLPATLNVAGKDFKGMELRRSEPVTFDEEVAEAILKKKGVYEEALSTYVDQEKIYRLVQEGKITEKDLDKIFIKGEQFAFWPVEGEVL